MLVPMIDCSTLSSSALDRMQTLPWDLQNSCFTGLKATRRFSDNQAVSFEIVLDKSSLFSSLVSPPDTHRWISRINHAVAIYRGYSSY